LLSFLVGFAGQWVLDKDPTVWPDGAKSANNCIPLSSAGNKPALPCSIPTPKSTFASIKNLLNLAKLLFYEKQKSEKEFGKIALGNIEFTKFGIFTSVTNSLPMFCVSISDKEKGFISFSPVLVRCKPCTLL
jgi:hypothetical protein